MNYLEFGSEKVHLFSKLAELELDFCAHIDDRAELKPHTIWPIKTHKLVCKPSKGAYLSSFIIYIYIYVS